MRRTESPILEIQQSGYGVCYRPVTESLLENKPDDHLSHCTLAFVADVQRGKGGGGAGMKGAWSGSTNERRNI